MNKKETEKLCEKTEKVFKKFKDYKNLSYKKDEETLKEILEAVIKQEIEDKASCPHCDPWPNRCPHCGRPYNDYSYYPYWPDWYPYRSDRWYIT